MMELGLENKVAVITGGSEGLGRAAAARLAAEGAKVVICARRADVLEATAQAIRADTGGTVLAVPTDVSQRADIDLKLMAAVRLCQAVIPGMRERRDGRIVNVTNTGGKAARAGGIPTSVTRAAGLNLTKALASEYAPHNIRVNSVCIGLVKSGQWERRAAAADADLDAYYADAGKRVPLGRMGEAEEFGDLIAFLVSDRAAFITGTAINFDGGMCPVL